MLEKVFFFFGGGGGGGGAKAFHPFNDRSWVPVHSRQVTQKRDKLNFPRALQNHIDFTRLDHR